MYEQTAHTVHGNKSTGMPPAVAGGLSCILIVLLFVTTHSRNALYLDKLTLWGDTLRKSPQSQRSIYNYGYALFTLGKDDDAITALSTLEHKPPGKIRRDHLYLQLGTSYFRMGKYENAVLAWHKGLEYAPHDAIFLNNLAMAYLRMDKFSSAKEYIAQALIADPLLKEAASTKGEILLAQKEYGQAAVWFLRSIERDPEDMSGYWFAAQAYAKAKRYGDARRYAEMALKKDGDEQFRNNILKFVESIDGRAGTVSK